MKWLFRLVLLVALVAGLGFFFYNFNVSGDKEGLTITKDKDRKWELPDGEEMVAKLKDKADDLDWDKFKKKASRGWDRLSNEMTDFTDQFDAEEAGEKARESMADLQEKTKKKYDKLVKKYENGDLNLDAFGDKVDELNAWVSKQMKNIKQEAEAL